MGENETNKLLGNIYDQIKETAIWQELETGKWFIFSIGIQKRGDGFNFIYPSLVPFQDLQPVEMSSLENIEAKV